MDPNVAMFLSFAVVSVFSFISVAAWAGARTEDRKAFYRSEMLKKLAESGPTAVAEYLREEEKTSERHRAERRDRVIEGNRLGGLILLVVGFTLMVTLHQIVLQAPVYLFGALPLGIGIVLLGSTMFGRRKN